MNYYPRVLVIGPGGQKGLMAVGFLSALEDAGILKYADTYCGVSVGAIISLLIVVGYDIRDIINSIINFDIFEDLASFSLRGVIDNKGLLSNQSIRSKLSKLIVDKFGMIPSLNGLYLRTGKALTVVTFNTTDNVCEIMNPFDNPDESCLDVTMCSINIPFIFYEMVHKGKTYIDGAFGNPYPIKYFDDGNTNVLGIFMKSECTNEKGIENYLTKILDSILYQRVNDIIDTSSNCCRHVILESKVAGFIGYNLSPYDKAVLLVDGHKMGTEYIKEYRAPKVLSKTYIYPEYFLIQEE